VEQTYSFYLSNVEQQLPKSRIPIKRELCANRFVVEVIKAILCKVTSDSKNVLTTPMYFRGERMYYAN